MAKGAVPAVQPLHVHGRWSGGPPTETITELLVSMAKNPVQ